MEAHTDSSMFLFDVPPFRMEMFCKIIDSGNGSLGWRDLAARILPSWSELRNTERLEAVGKSPTRELLWSWAQKNKTVGDLLAVLEDMGHDRALHLFMPGGKGHKHVITYSDIKEGTQNFHQNLKIGEGAFSEVYKGVKGNHTFAVKLFNQFHTQKKKASWKKLWKAFRTEIDVLHHYQHPNILEIWGCFSEGDRYCLVTPYLPNGSLSHWLHGQEVGEALSWQQRLDIIKGTARAVTHLHTAMPYSIICGNLTSANILLDGQLRSKLSDFGMACLRPHSVNQNGTITFISGPHCNLEYLPEEYIRDGKLSTKVDVYSLGVVVMETLTRQRPVLDGPKHIQLRDLLYGEVEENCGVDSCACYLDVSAGCWPHMMAISLFRLALECTASRPKGRPTMHAILQVLGELLPLPCVPHDQPRTLEDRSTVLEVHQDPGTSLPVEHDETQGPAPFTALQPVPCECSQSEVTFLGDKGVRAEWSEEAAAQGCLSGDQPRDLSCSWPVQCSCAAEEDGRECEDCRANGFSPLQADEGGAACCSQKQEVVENLAKENFRDKIQLYNKGLITEELLSMKMD